MIISAHASRWLIAAVAAPIILWVLFLGPPLAFLILVALAGGLAWWEYHSACFEVSRPGLLATALLGWLLVAGGAHFFGPVGQSAGLAAAVTLGCLFFLFRFAREQSLLDQLGRLVLGHGYLSLFLSFLILLYSLENGSRWILFCLLTTFLGDASAFYAGRNFGRRPLYPSVSPNKTWEGLAGGVIGSGVTAALTAAFLLPTPWHQAGLLGLLLGPWAAAGDLVESMLKRAVGVKDSGRLLMGHGGMWDRIDATLFNAPAVYLFAWLSGGH
ncbi:MAG: phosphatidate cytidylyltransferase [Thermodesulfobacteriota bacterium]